MKRGWLKYLLYSIAIIVGVRLLLALILAGYSVSWTGFADYTSPSGEFIRAKTFWDWMELLLIPLVFAGGAFFLNRSEKEIERKTAERHAKLEREIATDRQQEAALQSYLDRMGELMLRENLRGSEGHEARRIARIRTLTVLRGLDTARKENVLRFLYEANLINSKGDYFVDLEKADLRGVNLKGIDLSGSYLPFVDLSKADLGKAFFRGANLIGSRFNDANLSGAILQGCNLSSTDFSDADLSNAEFYEPEEYASGPEFADLESAKLNNANLRGAVITNDQLAKTESLKGTTMPDGTIHD